MKRTRYILIGTFSAVVFISLFWMLAPTPLTTAQLPDGTTKIINETDMKTNRWHEYTPSNLKASSSWSKMIVYFLSEKLHLDGKVPIVTAPISIPSPSRLVDFSGNMQPCADWGGKTILVADDLFDKSGTNWMAFDFGASKNADSYASWVQANLDCIRTKGVLILDSDGHILSKTPCAIIVNRATIKIIPSRHFVSPSA
jgi:hypothetical protein